jgi:hypothetical protein
VFGFQHRIFYFLKNRLLLLNVWVGQYPATHIFISDCTCLAWEFVTSPTQKGLILQRDKPGWYEDGNQLGSAIKIRNHHHHHPFIFPPGWAFPNFLSPPISATLASTSIFFSAVFCVYSLTWFLHPVHSLPSGHLFNILIFNIIQ